MLFVSFAIHFGTSCTCATAAIATTKGGVQVQLEGDAGAAVIAARQASRFEVNIEVDPRGARDPLTIRVDLPKTGRDTWPSADVVVLDARRTPLLVRRSGLEWHRLQFQVPPTKASYRVRAVERQSGAARQPMPSENERQATDQTTGLTATICRWHDGRRAALSIRFDDSHPTHLSIAIPILNQHGFKGTFMINPGSQNVVEHQREWEAVARGGKMELANHTMHHRGARNDEEMEREVGDACKYIWKACPDRSKLNALNLGGGTYWETTRPLRYYLDKYFLFDASQGSLGMDDTYGKRVAAIRRTVESHLQRGLWCRVHFHSIGPGKASSEANFRAALDVAKEYAPKLWIAGMADIHKYQQERRAARLTLGSDGTGGIMLRLACLTEPALYDQPLTIQLAWPATKPVVTDQDGKALPLRFVAADDGTIVRFDVPPTNATFTIRKR